MMTQLKIKIATCNIRTADAEDGPNNWELRKILAFDVIMSLNPDIICFQEMTKIQYVFFKEKLNEFVDLAPVDSPTEYSPANAIFFKKKFSLVSFGNYWLSKTPHIAGSKSWNAMYPRMVNWVRLKSMNTEFRVINTHLSHISQEARENEIQMILKDCDAYPKDYPQILTGDFNCNSMNKVISLVLSNGFHDSYEMVYGEIEPERTFHEFQGNKANNTEGKIDWILLRGKVKSVDSRIVKDSKDDQYPSDHYFLTSDIIFIP